MTDETKKVPTSEEAEAATQQPENRPLFRKEVLQAKKGSYFGKTIIITPISFSVWVFGIFGIAVAVALYLGFGEYAKRQTVEGLLVPDQGLITLYARNPGTVTQCFVQQGAEITKGQLLYLVSTEHEALLDQGLSAQQVALLEKQIEVQKAKIAMYEKKAADYDELLKQHFISELEYQNRRNDYLDAKLALHSYESKLNEAKSGAEYAIRAPAGGVISMLAARVGDRVASDTQVGAIVPKGSKLEAQLFVPTSKAGFVKLGQKVLLKYRAYPFQLFGLYDGVVSSIDKSIINPRDQRSYTGPIQVEEAFYRVNVTLARQTVKVYGQPYPLTPGMLLQGIILGEKRNIWQWIFDPLYSLKGSL